MRTPTCQALVDAGTGPGSGDDGAIAALQKSFTELMQEREQQACSMSSFSSTLGIPDGSPMGCTVCRSRFIAYVMMSAQALLHQRQSALSLYRRRCLFHVCIIA